MKFAKYYEIMRIDLIEKATYIWNQLMFVVIIGTVLFIFMHLWTAIFAGKATIEGFTIAQMIWYLAFAEVLMMAQDPYFIEKLGSEVRTGAVGITLLKPLSYLWKTFAHIMGNFIFRFITIGIIALMIAQYLVGMIPMDLTVLPLILLVSFGAAIMNFFIIGSFGFLAFWLEDTTSLAWMYQKTLFILGGMLVPLDVYPTWIQGYLTYLPSSFLIYYPSKLFVHFSWDMLWFTLIGQLVWIVIAAIALHFIYQQGLKKVNVHGG